MKKILLVLFLILIMNFLISCEETGNTIDNLIFEDVVENDEVIAYKIIGYNKKLPKRITLPETFTTSEHGKKPVTIIGIGAFSSSHIKSIVIPESYLIIEEEAFLGSIKLEKVIFTGDSKLVEIGNNAFKFTTHLKKIVIPKSVKRIGEYAFSEAMSLISVIFEEDSELEIIENNAFSGTINLKEITLPARVKNIDMPIFHNAKKLENIYVDENNTYFASVNGVLYNYDKTILITYPRGKKDVNYSLLDEVLTISKYAFYNNEYLEEINLNNNLKQINTFAFARMINLKSLIIPINVIKIEKDVFKEVLDLVLYFEHLEPSSGFESGWNSSSLKVYYKPNWDFDADLMPKPVD